MRAVRQGESFSPRSTEGNVTSLSPKSQEMTKNMHQTFNAADVACG